MNLLPSPYSIRLLHLYRCNFRITFSHNSVKFLHLYKRKERTLIMNLSYEIAFGKNIKTLRKKKKLTQEQLAAQLQVNGCDITRSALAKIEVGQRHLYPDEIRTLKELLGVSFDEIFYFDTNK